ncbi:MAG: hypothetical protein ACREPM_22745 [Gemmatimonadaceae bacterium]
MLASGIYLSPHVAGLTHFSAVGWLTATIFASRAPLRLRNGVQLGCKQVEWISSIEFVTDIAEVGSGFGGYNEDHEFFGYRQSI